MQANESRHPQFRLRVEDIRVFYDVIDLDVVIIAIMPKEDTILSRQQYQKGKYKTLVENYPSLRFSPQSSCAHFI